MTAERHSQRSVMVRLTWTEDDTEDCRDVVESERFSSIGGGTDSSEIRTKKGGGA